jgi:stearoyl-CoA desaturase (delta-9 desaturase)
MVASQLELADTSSSLADGQVANGRKVSARRMGPRREHGHEWPPHDKELATAHRSVSHDEHVEEEENVWARGLDWPVVLWISFAHVGALGAFFFFTWKAVALFAVLFWITGSLGVCMGYHRLLTHGSFGTYRPIRWLFALLGSLSGEGSAITWVSTHRKHHAHSDKDGDPHSPRDGGLWAHFLWLMPNHGAKYHADMASRYAPDLTKDPVMRFLHSTFLVWHWVFGLALYFIGWYFWDHYTAWSFIFWGVFLRMVYVLHVTWFVNSATHIWGYRNYETTDDSTNLWWVGLLAFGEGWHNNHHAYQRMARHGHRWWEVDITYWGICALEKIGLAWNVVRKVPSHQKPA